jgi:hypothetical protein
VCFSIFRSLPRFPSSQMANSFIYLVGFFLLLLSSSLLMVDSSFNEELTEEDIIEYVNSGEFGWRAVPLPECFEQEGKVMKTRRTSHFFKLKHLEASLPKEAVSPPDSFDWRDESPDCVGYIRNQGSCGESLVLLVLVIFVLLLPFSFYCLVSYPCACAFLLLGSCWAFGCAESLSDRFCIHSNGNVQVNLTTEELVACNLDGLEGCSGGEPVSAFTYAAVSGLATEECIPYLFGANGTGPSCRQVPRDSCSSGAPSTTFLRYHSILDSLRWLPDESLMQNEIFTNGPIEACFEVYQDFMNYNSGKPQTLTSCSLVLPLFSLSPNHNTDPPSATGVYTHVTGSAVGGHCIKLLGWGTYNETTPYWLAQNSWGPTWGLEGYFLIKRGDNECGIEREAFCALPNLSS